MRSKILSGWVGFSVFLLLLTGQARAGAALECYALASATGLGGNPDLATRLCSGATNAKAVVECFHQLNRHFADSGSALVLSPNERATACAGATSLGAVAGCLERSFVGFEDSLRLNRAEATRLCAGAPSAEEPVECYRTARGPGGQRMSQTFAIRLCSSYRGLF